MANEDHLQILNLALKKRDITIWNKWREENPDIFPELMEVKLSRANLHRANLNRANLSRANLFGANLKEANLTEANLVGAYFNGTDLRNSRLSNADLTEAFLIEANLTRADLAGANLSHARLTEANLSGADLTGANLSGADLNNADLTSTNFSGADLTDSKIAEANLIGTDLISRTESKGFDKESYFLESNMKMVQVVRSWSWWCLGWGVVNLIFSSFSSPFGLLLIILGLIAHFLKSAAIFIAFGVIFIWAAISNFFVGGFWAIAFSVALVIFAIQSLNYYRRYRPIEAGILAGNNSDSINTTETISVIRSERFLPWFSFIIALLSLAGFILAFLASIALTMAIKAEQPPPVMGFITISFLELGILALALGLAAVMSHYSHKALSIIGMLGGAVSILLLITLIAAGSVTRDQPRNPSILRSDRVVARAPK